MQERLIAIAGNIGVGKSSLTDQLASARGMTPVYEAVAENPYLADFYKDMRRWGFQSQIFFLSRRIKQQAELRQMRGSIVQDRTIYEDAEVFARHLHLEGILGARDWGTYNELYQAATLTLRAPDQVVYLKASVPVLAERIRKRGRDFERSLSLDYLTRLNELYDEWARDFRLAPLITIDTDPLDFVERPADLAWILEQVK